MDRGGLMSGSALIRRRLGGDEHDFRLGIAQAEELQDITGLGLLDTMERVATGSIAHIRHVLRLARVGAGVSRESAETFVKTHLVEGEVTSAAGVALDAINALLRGAPEDPLGESQGERIQNLSPAAA
jgi:hypothetical protein